MKLLVKKRTVIIVIIGLLLVLSLNFFQKEVRGFFYSISVSVQKSLWKKGSDSSIFFGAIFEAKNLKQENENLKLKIQELLSEQVSLKEAEEENKILRDALNLGLQDEFKLELAEIIGKDVNQDSILIDKGLKDGISKGFAVITSQKVLMGTTAEVYQNYSRVLLISDKKTSLEVQISGTNTSGLVKGLGGFRVLLDLVPKENEIKEGDLVVSKGFLIGLVRRVEKIDVNPFQQAEISPLFDISKSDKVFIVLDL